MRPAPIKGTLARLEEGLIFDRLVSIFMFVPNMRFPPFILPLMSVAISTPLLHFMLFEGNPITLVLSIAIGLLCFAMIPVFTYLTLKNRSYQINNDSIVQSDEFLKSERKTVNLNRINQVMVREGILFSRFLNIGKVLLIDPEENLLMQIDYTENPEEVKETIENITRKRSQ
jgi:uncharacterized membrane protein YdbT with pleckstrin-like domain